MISPETIALPTPVAPPLRARSMPSVLANRWARILIPSLSDLFFLAILIWLFMSSGATGWQGLLVDGDAGWHIRTGEYILDHRAVPRQDLYSFSKPGAPWYAWEWLTDAMYGGLYRLAGLKGIVLTAGVTIAAFAVTLIRRMAWRGVHPMIAMVVALLGVGGASIHFLARPHIFTLLLLSISVWMLEADLEHPSRRIWWLAPLTGVWTNLHGGFLALIAVLGLTAVGTAVEACMGRSIPDRHKVDWRNAGWNRAARYSLLTAACAAASLVNPYGYRLHLHVIEYLRSDWIRSVIQEFQSPSFRGENMLQFEALLLTGLIVAGALFRRGRIVEALWIVCFAHLALGSARPLPLYIAVTAPLIAAEIGAWWQMWTEGAGKASLAGILNGIAADAQPAFRRTSAWPVAVVAALMLIRQPIPWPTDFPAEVFPVKMVRAHAAEILNARVLTTDQWADYLIYVNPRQKVFVDGRSDFYGPDVGNQYLHLIYGHWDWERLMAAYGFNLALLPVESPLAQLLKRYPGWRAVEDDGKTILLVRGPAAPPYTGNSGTGPRF